MATTRPFAFNTGTTISGSSQTGDLAIGVDALRYDLDPGGVTWYMGCDEDLGYVIGLPVPSTQKPTFLRSDFTNESYLDLVNEINIRQGGDGFNEIVDAKNWVDGQGYWTTFPDIPSENPAISRLQNFWTAINAYYVEWNDIPSTQAELSAYMSFSPDGAYTFSYDVATGVGYFQATSNSELIHSYTRTVTDDLGDNIICKKLGTTAPGPADLDGGTLSCQSGTEEV